jgi:Concanavalin A-like lectin/glucanases superfamily/PEP-CTERM motif
MKTTNFAGLRFSPSRKVKITAGAMAALSVSWSAFGSLIGQWVGDNYTSGNWNDSSGNGHTGTLVGTVSTSISGFNGHKSIVFPGGDGAAAMGHFTVTNNASTLVGATALTLAAVFNPTAANTSVGGQFWQKSGLIGNEQPGAVGDWGLGFGGSQAAMGVGAPDTTIVSPVVDPALNTPHIAIGQWSTAGTMTLYVDGVQVAQNTSSPTGIRDANASGAFGLGVSVALQNNDTHIFTGQIAELRAYNDITQDPTALYNSLRNIYIIPEPASVALLGLGAFALLRRRRRPSTA